MELYSMKMRASRKERHVSGAEKIIPGERLSKNAAALIERALHHAKGQADFIQVKIEAVPDDAIEYVDALAVSTREVATASEGRDVIREMLKEAGVENIDAVMNLFHETYKMRGAMLLDADTLERLEPDKERGIRATYMDAERSREPTSGKNHFQEAVVLASKVVNAPNIVAEICISDDPDYVTGYVASKKTGYVRITKLKEPGDPDGGRIFIYRGARDAVAETIRYIEKQRVLVKDAPDSPGVGQKKTPYDVLAEDIEKRKEAGLYRSMRTIGSAQCSHVTVDGRDMLMLASNSYLGLVDDRRVTDAAKDALERYGAGSGGSRLTTGNLALHEALEAHIARFKGTQAALLFGTGYMANVGIISALGRSGAVIFSDELNHASIIDGCRLSRAETIVYRHLDMRDLEEKIRAASPSFGLIVSDAVFSMDGDVAPLPEIMALSKKYGMLSMVDEAHATGVVGKSGHGIVEYFGLDEKPDVIMGTLSKSLASEGGFAAGDALLIDYLKNSARSFIYTTSQSPANLAAADAALTIIEEEPWRVARLQQNAASLIDALRQEGISTSSESAIIPILTSDEGLATRAAGTLYDEGIFLSAIRYPTVARGSARLRAAVMATHTTEEMHLAAKKIAAAIR